MPAINGEKLVRLINTIYVQPSTGDVVTAFLWRKPRVIGHAREFHMEVVGVTARASIASVGARKTSGTTVITCGTFVKTINFDGHGGSRSRAYQLAAKANAKAALYATA